MWDVSPYAKGSARQKMSASHIRLLAAERVERWSVCAYDWQDRSLLYTDMAAASPSERCCCRVFLIILSVLFLVFIVRSTTSTTTYYWYFFACVLPTT